MKLYHVINCYGTIVASSSNYDACLKHIYKLSKRGYGNISDYSIRLVIVK
jgi:hypothetical protein